MSNEQWQGSLAVLSLSICPTEAAATFVFRLYLWNSLLPPSVSAVADRRDAFSLIPYSPSLAIQPHLTSPSDPIASSLSVCIVWRLRDGGGAIKVG